MDFLSDGVKSQGRPQITWKKMMH